jgi:hypothetical protein
MTPDRHRRPHHALLLTALVAAVALAPLRPAPAAAADPGIQPRANVDNHLSHQVYGYLPYWRLNGGTAGQLDYDLVSTIAFFGLGIKATGDIDMAWRGTQAYLSSDATAVTNAAHAKGVRVVPTFQLFDSGSLPKMTAFLGSASAQNRFIGQALNLMERRAATARTSTSSRCRPPRHRNSWRSSRSSGRRWTPASRRDARERDVGRRAAVADHRPRPDRRRDVRHDLQLPLDRLDGDRRNRPARPRQPQREDPHEPVRGLRAAGQG